MAEQGRRQPPKRIAPRPPSSWLPVEWEQPDAYAIQALARGEADPDQQKRALRWILVNACEVDEPSYCPTSQDDTIHHEGRRWVGLQIRKLMNLALSRLR